MENTENLESNENVNFQSRINLEPLRESIDKIKAEMETVIVGQHKMIDQLLVAMLANGHVLIEGVPGVAKTLTAKIIAKTIAVDFSGVFFSRGDEIEVKVHRPRFFVAHRADIPALAAAFLTRNGHKIPNFAVQHARVLPIGWHVADELHGFRIFCVIFGRVGHHLNG